MVGLEQLGTCNTSFFSNSFNRLCYLYNSRETDGKWIWVGKGVYNRTQRCTIASVLNLGIYGVSAAVLALLELRSIVS